MARPGLEGPLTRTNDPIERAELRDRSKVHRDGIHYHS